MAEHRALRHHGATTQLHPAGRSRLATGRPFDDVRGGDRVGVARVCENAHLADPHRRFPWVG